MGTSFVVFGLISNLENQNVYIVLALVNRFLQGFSSTLIQTTMYSICTNFFPDNKDAMVGYIEAVTGVGLILGPLIGSGLYSIGGYQFIFFSFGSFFIVFSAFIRCIFDEKIDNQNFEDDNLSTGTRGNTIGGSIRNFIENDVEVDDNFANANDRRKDDEERIIIGTFELLKYPRFFFAALSGTLGYFLYGFMEPILAFRVS